jgi:hypothetical protein
VTDTDPPDTGNMLRYYYLLQRLVVVADVDGSASSVEVLALRKDVGTKTLSPSSVSTKDPQNTQKNIVGTVYVPNLLELRGLHRSDYETWVQAEIAAIIQCHTRSKQRSALISRSDKDWMGWDKIEFSKGFFRRCVSGHLE